MCTVSPSLYLDRMLPLSRSGTRALHLHAWSRLSASAIARVYVTVCLLVTAFSGIAQSGPGDDLIVKELDMKRVVNGLVLDKDGFLWIATLEGLYRFDGYDFDLVGGETLPHLNVPEKHISAVLEDRAGNIWVGGRAIYVISADSCTGRTLS
jgi:ligand-binding sensor domain-containing protein